MSSSLGIILILGAGLLRAAAQDALPEKQVKAAFLVNFPKYVEWPAETFPQTNSPIVLVVIGDSDAIEPLAKMIQGRTYSGRSMVLKRVAADEAAPQGCHIVFISDSERRRLPALLAKFAGQSVLTVGESEQFLEKGGIISLARRDQKIRLDINLEGARAVRLQISSKLLGVADFVKGKPH